MTSICNSSTSQHHLQAPPQARLPQPSFASPWFTTGGYADDLVTMSGHSRAITDAAGELLSYNTHIRRLRISVRRDQAERQISRLDAMRNEKAGWDGCDAAAPNLATIDLASALLRQFAEIGLPIPVATMSPSGNAALFSNEGGAYADIELHVGNVVSWLIQLPSGPEIEDREPYCGQGDNLLLIDYLRRGPGAIA